MCFLVVCARDFKRPMSTHPASRNACNKAATGIFIPDGAWPVKRSQTDCQGPPSTPDVNSPIRARIISTRNDSAPLIPVSTMMALASVIGGAAPALKADTSRAISQAATLEKPPDLYQAHIQAAASASMQRASDHKTNQRRSLEGMVMAIRSLENATTCKRLTAS